MDHPDRFTALTAAWLTLGALTLMGLGLGEWFGSAGWLPLLVAAILWLKSAIVARSFVETDGAHAFVAWLMRVFIALAPLALLATAFFGATIARWATL